MNLAIIGGGPSGLFAAETASLQDLSVALFEAKPSVGRKFLVAGKGGLNLTKSEPLDTFASRYINPEAPFNFWPSTLAHFDSDALRKWAASLGVDTFVASTNRVYPKELRAAPLLRRWVQRLRERGVSLSMRHKLIGIKIENRIALEFAAPAENKTIHCDAAILALGGASWPETGSDGSWCRFLESHGVHIQPFAPANCGWECRWPSSLLSLAEGKPLKAIHLTAGNHLAKGELLVTRYGLEGGALYQLGPTLRNMESPAIHIDFRPHSTEEQLIAKMGPIQHNFLNEARQRLRLDDATFALLLNSSETEPFDSSKSLAHRLKNFFIPLKGPRPIDEAISSAGGIRFSELDENLMIKKLPGVFVAGEMIDWEAPTGGYLLQGSFATGRSAAENAALWVNRRNHGRC